MKNSREKYVDECVEIVKGSLLPGQNIIEYHRKGQNKRRVGAVVVFRDPTDGQVKFGWSLCNIKQDKFDKNIALAKAVERSVPLTREGKVEVPSSMLDRITNVLNRAVRFFKLGETE
jgi:hypothetical protein